MSRRLIRRRVPSRPLWRAGKILSFIFWPMRWSHRCPASTPDLSAKRPNIVSLIRQEEERFFGNVEGGTASVSRTGWRRRRRRAEHICRGPTSSGFYDTYGFARYDARHAG